MLSKEWVVFKNNGLIIITENYKVTDSMWTKVNLKNVDSASTLVNIVMYFGLYHESGVSQTTLPIVTSKIFSLGIQCLVLVCKKSTLALGRFFEKGRALEFW